MLQFVRQARFRHLRYIKLVRDIRTRLSGQKPCPARYGAAKTTRKGKDSDFYVVWPSALGSIRALCGHEPKMPFYCVIEENVTLFNATANIMDDQRRSVTREAI